MSRMITDTNEIAPDLALKPKLRKITFHPSQLTASKLIQWNRGTQQRQEQLLKHICKKIIAHQSQQIKTKSYDELNMQMLGLRKRLRNTLSHSTIEKIMGQNPMKEHNSLSKVLKVQTQLVDITKKYGKQIKMKLSMIKQTEKIQKEKERLKDWENQSRNSPLKSPQFRKMNYLLKKCQKQNIRISYQYQLPISQRYQNKLRKSLDDNLLTYRCQSPYKKRKQARKIAK